MKTKLFLIGIILGVALFTAGCKKVAGRTYTYSGSACSFISLMFTSSSEMQFSGNATTFAYTQEGDKITINVGAAGFLIFNKDATGCLVWVSGPYGSATCKYCE